MRKIWELNGESVAVLSPDWCGLVAGGRGRGNKLRKNRFYGEILEVIGRGGGGNMWKTWYKI